VANLEIRLSVCASVAFVELFFLHLQHFFLKRVFWTIRSNHFTCYRSKVPILILIYMNEVWSDSMITIFGPKYIIAMYLIPL